MVHAIQAFRSGRVWNIFSVSIPKSSDKTTYPTVGREERPIVFWISFGFWVVIAVLAPVVIISLILKGIGNP